MRQFVSMLLFIALYLVTDITEAKTFQVPAANAVEQDTTKRKVKVKPYESDRYGDPIANPKSKSPLLLNNWSNLKLNIALDTSGQYYRVDESIGNINYRPPSMMPFQDYKDYLFKKQQKEHWRTLSLQQDGEDALPGENGKRLIPPIYLGRVADRLFGGSTMEFQTSGNVMLDFGGLWQNIENPQIPVNQQSTGGFNFDQQIALSLEGKIGEKLSISGNFDTKSNFQFEQQYNLSYTAYDHDIIQDLQIGNVSFPVTNSLISGSQNLFGVYTKLRFGKLYVSSVFSSQRGSTETLVVKNGAQTKDFEVRSDNYESNKHFFLSHFFRDRYEEALKYLPNINSGVVVTRVKVFVTNRKNDTQTLRSVAAYMDLGEQSPYNTKWSEFPITEEGADNGANKLYAELIKTSRDANNVREESETLGMKNGSEFEVLRASRELMPDEFTFDPLLGYISLRSPIRNDEVLAVAYEYTYQGKSYKVGELNEDYTNLSDSDIIFMKMLSPASINTQIPTWDLMMKNIYSLQSNNVQKENFQLRVIYRDDASGVDNPSLHEGTALTNVPLIQVMGLDRLNPNLEFQKDGNFDYVEGVTIQSNNGVIIFPKLEPFGETLSKKIDEGTEGVTEKNTLKEKYVFSDLYNATQADAKLNTYQNKYFIRGSFESGSSGDIMLPGINISENSVSVTAGGVTLTEGSDYTVDYQFGRVKILNAGVLNSNKDIKIQFERADLFGFQTKTLAGANLEYHVSDDFKITGTIMHHNEQPMIRRVAVGSEPTKNTIWGLTVDYRNDSRFLTKLVDGIPGLSTKEKSTVSFKGEFAQLIPSAPSLIGESGVGYIDDFEGASSPYDLTRGAATNWSLGSVPTQIKDNFPSTFQNKRARLAWYNIDNVFYYTGNGTASRPDNISDEMLENHYMRRIAFDEVFQNKQRSEIITNEMSFDLAYYPEERGAYNYSTDVTNQGKLNNPAQNYGAITKAITHDVDFDNLNIQYIEFWLLDPFIQGENGKVDGVNNTTGGKLYFNLGNVSEDVIPDGRHFFENGLSNDRTQNNEGDLGYTPNTPYLNNAFNPAVPREAQDVGFDGLSSEDEAVFFNDKFILNLPASLSADAKEEIVNDPSSDDFRYYLDGEADAMNLDILQRYKKFNGPEGNSPESNSNASFPQSSTTLPDNEDLNRDNTISELEQYYQYEVNIKPNEMSVGQNYIVDKVSATIPESGETVNWYQFRIPIRGDKAESVNSMTNYKTIRFMRTFMTDWEQPVVLRMVQFQLVGVQWRPHEANLESTKEIEIPVKSTVNVSTVNIEENGTTTGEDIPYMLPPGIERDYDATSTVTRQINEQSVQMCVDDLTNDQDESRAIYKNLTTDLVNYKRIKMELHAQSPNSTVGDDELTGFIRLGTDFDQNYYEIEVPLKITRRGANTPEQIWPRENAIDVALDELYGVKSERNHAGLSTSERYTPDRTSPFYSDKHKIYVIGRPDLSTVQTVMIGVRSKKGVGQNVKQVCIWANELRATEYNTFSGWAVNANMDAQLADFATLRTGVKYSTAGFGGIQDKVGARQRDTRLSFDVSSNISLDKFYLNKIGISLPLFVSYERSTSDPYFDPLDPDVPLDVAITARSGNGEGGNYRTKVQDYYDAFSINVSGLSKKKMLEGAKSYPWDVENLVLSGSYSKSFLRNQNTESLDDIDWKLGATYTYQSPFKGFTPFKDVKWMKGKYWALIKDFNFNPLPSSFTVRGDMSRRFKRIQLRNKELDPDPLLLNFEKSFLFNRNYNLNWNLTKSLKLDYAATANAIIDEPEGEMDQAAQDSVWTNIKNFGRMKQFQQSISGTYTLPLNKIPLLDWTNSDVRYTGGSTWTAGTVMQDDSGNEIFFGNNLQNNQQVSVNGQINLKKLYDKSPYLKWANKKVRKRTSARPPRPGSKPRRRRLDPSHPLNVKKKKLKAKIKKLEAREKKRKEKESAKLEALTTELKEEIKTLKEKGEETAKLELKLSELTATTATGNGEVDLNRRERRIEKLKKDLKKVEEEIKEYTKGNTKGDKSEKAIKNVAKFLTMVKDINGSYSQNNGTNIPGFAETPKFFGLDENWKAPGLPFLLGSQDPDIGKNIRPYLVQNADQTTPFQQRAQEEIRLKANLEPIKDLKITLEANRQKQTAYTEVVRFNEDTFEFESQSPQRTGSWGMSFFTLPTAFISDDANNVSPVFEQFLANRDVMQSRLTEANPGMPYTQNDQDVLIPAFIAAYTGQDASSIDFSPFPTLPIPNWQVSYSGLSKTKLFSGVFKSVTINHRYTSSYNVGSYSSSLIYGISDIGIGVDENDAPLASQVGDGGQVVPVYVINQVNIDEQFSPLIGVSLKTVSDFQIRFDYKKARRLSLNLSNAQVTEQQNNDFVVDVGYTKANLKLPFKSRGRSVVLKNDVTLRLAFTIRDSEVIQRSSNPLATSTGAVDRMNVVTSGNWNFQLKPTLNYVLNDRANLQFYFERAINEPKVSTAYRRTTTAFGFQLRYDLTQQ